MITVPITQGRYSTASDSGNSLCRMLPSACFYIQALTIVTRAAWMARQGIYTDGDWTRSSLDILRSLERCGVEFEVDGMEHVCADVAPCVFIGNHMSTLETFVLPTLIAPYRQLTFVVKQSLVDYPVFKYVMRSRNPIVVQRTNPREDLKAVLNQGGERLARGISIIVFPQTTRTTTFDAGQFNSIGIKLAKKAGVPIIPVALKTDAWSNGRWLKDFGVIDPKKKVRISFAAPIDSSAPTAEIKDGIVGFIEERLRGWDR